MIKERIAIPNLFYEPILKDIHKKHLGIERYKAILVYWQGIDINVDGLVKDFEKCASAARIPPKMSLSIWGRIHIDYAESIEDFYFLDT